MILNFNDFIKNLVTEELHPEVQEIVKSNITKGKKQDLLARKIKDLTSRGESTGIEGNMPKGSSRAYLQHSDMHEINLDGKPTHIKTGIKVAIKSPLDVHHNKSQYDGMSLGQMQNDAENNDHFVNNSYRILRHIDGNKFESNHDQGIFPPLIDYDDKNHHWAHVGHVRDIKGDKEFHNLTKSQSHPNGISHTDFVDTLVRDHNRYHGKYWEKSADQEKNFDNLEQHPLVEKFLDHQRNMASPPHDYGQLKNLGVFEHPDGTKHIVARDHGFSTLVSDAYTNAVKKRADKYFNKYR